MPQGELPALSLLIQLSKQLTTPMSKKMVNYAKSHPFFRKYCLILPGRCYYWCEAQTRYFLVPDKSVNKKQKLKFKEVDDKTAESLGIQLMIEVISFTKFCNFYWTFNPPITGRGPWRPHALVFIM